jgi:hypothetical protein
MQNPPQVSGDVVEQAPPPPPPPPSPPPPPTPELALGTRRRRRRPSRAAPAVVPLAVVSVVLGILLGGRAAAEDGRSAAAALAAQDPARAVSLDEAVAGRSGFLMLLDPGAAAAAEHDAQLARITWARQLAASGDVDSALTVLAVVRQPSLIIQAALTRAQLLIDAASAASKAGHAELALLRLNEAARGQPPAAVLTTIATMRAIDEVEAAAELVVVGRAPDAVALLDDAAANGALAAAAAVYPATLLAAGQAEITALDFQQATTTLQRLVSNFGRTTQARQAMLLLRAPQSVSGTLVDASGRGIAGRVRLSTHFTQLSGGYATSGPFYYGTSDVNGDFAVRSVPVGGPYVLEYFRDSGWMTLVDPRTDQPANPVTVTALMPADLTFIILPA